jgi:hypothetical protein
MKLKYGQPVQITWIDACSRSGWNEPFEEGLTVVSVGAFVRQNKRGICLASGLDYQDKELVLGAKWIPRGMIAKIRRLR